MGSAPWRENASSRRSSNREKLRSNGRNVASTRASRIWCARITEVTATMPSATSPHPAWVQLSRASVMGSKSMLRPAMITTLIGLRRRRSTARQPSITAYLAATGSARRGSGRRGAAGPVRGPEPCASGMPPPGLAHAVGACPVEAGSATAAQRSARGEPNGGQRDDQRHPPSDKGPTEQRGNVVAADVHASGSL